MIAHKYQYKDRADDARANEPSRIVVKPSSEQYVEKMEQLQILVYEPTPEEGLDGILTADCFRNHLRVFPEGQFIAVDTATDEVVGLTASMRLDFYPAESLLDSWSATTGDG
jgi:hypothetical protein